MSLTKALEEGSEYLKNLNYEIKERLLKSLYLSEEDKQILDKLSKHSNKAMLNVDQPTTMGNLSLLSARDDWFKRVIIHRFHVYRAGMSLIKNPVVNKILEVDELDFELNLLNHDLSKFSDEESYGYIDMIIYNTESHLSKTAWLHHKNFNEHHPEHWLDVDKDMKVTPVPIPDIYILEMVADWVGAGVTYGSTLEEWGPKNVPNITFHEDTKKKVYQILKAIGINL